MTKTKIKKNYKIKIHKNGSKEIKYLIKKNECIRCSKCDFINKCLTNCYFIKCSKCNYKIKLSIYKKIIE